MHCINWKNSGKSAIFLVRRGLLFMAKIIDKEPKYEGENRYS